MCREYTLNGSNRKSPISGGRNALIKLTDSEMHGIKEMSRGNFGRIAQKRKAGTQLPLRTAAFIPREGVLLEAIDPAKYAGRKGAL